LTSSAAIEATERPAALRVPGADEQLLHQDGGARNVGGVLEQCRVPRHQRGRGEADHLPEREVPRHHGQHRAERPIADHRGLGSGVGGVGRGDPLVGEQCRPPVGEPAHGLDALGHLGGGLCERLAHLQGHGPRGVVLLGLQQVGGGVQQCRALRELRGPVLGEGGRGAREAGLDAVRVQRFEGFEGLPRGGVDAGDGHTGALLSFTIIYGAFVPMRNPVIHAPSRPADNRRISSPSAACGAAAP
jgi:hypothetical protein